MLLNNLSHLVFASFPVERFLDNEILLEEDPQIFQDILMDGIIPLLVALTPIIYFTIRLIQANRKNIRIRKPLKIWEKVILWGIGIFLLLSLIFFAFIFEGLGGQ